MEQHNDLNAHIDSINQSHWTIQHWGTRSVTQLPNHRGLLLRYTLAQPSNELHPQSHTPPHALQAASHVSSSCPPLLSARCQFPYLSAIQPP